MPVTIFFLALALFFGSFKLAYSLAMSNPKVAFIGEKMLLKKERQLATSKLFAELRKAIRAGNRTKAFAVIFPLMVLKSVAFYFIGYILVLPFLLVVQGVMMGSLFLAYKKVYQANSLFIKVSFWQLSSHLIVAAYGFVVGLEWIFDLDFLQNLKPSWAASIYAYAVLSVIWSVVAAYLEVCMLMHDQAIRKLH